MRHTQSGASVRILSAMGADEEEGMVRRETIHFLGHAPLLAIVALLAMTQACSGGGTGDSGFDGSYGIYGLYR